MATTPQGKPHKRQFKVSEDLRRLKWCFLPSRNLLMQRARDPVRPATKQVSLSRLPYALTHSQPILNNRVAIQS
jgi:hypothetical protein